MIDFSITYERGFYVAHIAGLFATEPAPDYITAEQRALDIIGNVPTEEGAALSADEAADVDRLAAHVASFFAPALPARPCADGCGVSAGDSGAANGPDLPTAPVNDRTAGAEPLADLPCDVCGATPTRAAWFGRWPAYPARVCSACGVRR